MIDTYENFVTNSELFLSCPSKECPESIAGDRTVEGFVSLGPNTSEISQLERAKQKLLTRKKRGGRPATSKIEQVLWKFFRIFLHLFV
jgi:hypothetical protein